MDIMLARASIRKADVPINLADTLRTNIPAKKLPAPAHTASNAVAIATSPGSRPLSIKAGIRCNASVSIPKERIEKAAVRVHIETVLSAWRVGQDNSIFSDCSVVE